MCVFETILSFWGLKVLFFAMKKSYIKFENFFEVFIR